MVEEIPQANNEPQLNVENLVTLPDEIKSLRVGQIVNIKKKAPNTMVHIMASPHRRDFRLMRVDLTTSTKIKNGTYTYQGVKTLIGVFKSNQDGSNKISPVSVHVFEKKSNNTYNFIFFFRSHP